MTLLVRLVEASERVGASSARLAKVRELANLLRSLEPAEIAIGVQNLSGELSQGRIGIGPAVLQAASDVPPADAASLSLTEVDRTLTDIAALRGPGVNSLRAAALRDLFGRATAAEQRFLYRLLLGELRQGALAGVMVDAIAAAAELPVGEVRRAMMYGSRIGAVAQAALREGSAGLARFQLEVLSPVAPMLAQTAADPADALRQLGGEAAFEWKMDGARIQAHKSGDTVRILHPHPQRGRRRHSRNRGAGRGLAGPRPDTRWRGNRLRCQRAGRTPFRSPCGASGASWTWNACGPSCRCMPFSSTACAMRARTWPTGPPASDSGSLRKSLPDALRIPQRITASAAEAQAFYEDALAAGHEGVMAKSLDAPYEAGNRGASWLKIKRVHTLDLVVIAAEWGHGRRNGKLSNLHLGALDTATGEYVMLGKTFKGLTDAMLAWQTRELLARETHRDGITVHVRPELVAEIAFSDLQASTRYPGGIALRLARVKRYREDKSAEQADTMEAVRRIHASQSVIP